MAVLTKLMQYLWRFFYQQSLEKSLIQFMDIFELLHAY